MGLGLGLAAGVGAAVAVDRTAGTEPGVADRVAEASFGEVSSGPLVAEHAQATMATTTSTPTRATIRRRQ
ncbi:hypothetical protein GCM10010517_01800 [Streptosporangium fragile]|uniref:Uncharacterized protein n=1 Tax=Streptosporangium fragile TaxID=46186 RepID=A0ABN3VNX5_9ACTN